MAGDKRSVSADLEARLLKNGGNFSFFQAVRLLKLALSEDESGGGLNLRPNLSLAFPGREVESIRKTEDGFETEINFFSLYGASSPLPTFCTEELFEEERLERSETRALIDIFSRRLYELLFSVLSKYKAWYQIAEEGNEEILKRMLSLLGQREPKPADSSDGRLYPLRRAALLIRKNRTTAGLESFLKDALGVPISVLPCRKRTVPLPEDQLPSLGVENSTVGEDFHIGDEFVDRGETLIRVGPLEAGPRLEFTPGGTDYRKLIELTALYLGTSADHLSDPDSEIAIEPVLKDRAEPMRLGEDRWSALGRDAWLL